MQFTKHTAIVLSCVAAGLNAQTPAPAPNAAPSPAAAPSTGTPTNPNARVLSLDEAIRLALEHNYNVKIQQFNPEIARYSLKAEYGVYDPRFNFTVQREDRQEESRIAGGLATTNTHERVDSFTGLISGLPDTDEARADFIAGLLPTGMRYELYTEGDHRKGTISRGRLDQYTADVGFNLRQPLLRDMWIDEARATIAMAKKDVALSEYALQQTMMETVLATRQAYFELVAAADNVKVYERALELANQAVAEARKRVQVGTVLPLTEKSAEAAAATARADVLAAKRQRDLQENILKSLISDNYEKWHNTVITPSERLLAIPQAYNLEASWLDGLTLRPDFNSLRAEVEKQGIEVKFRKNQLFPYVDLTGGAGQTGVAGSSSGAAGDIWHGRNPYWAVGVMVSIPFTFTAERNSLKAAQAKREQLELQLQKAHQTVIISIDDAVKQAQSAYSRIEATREARMYSETALEAALKRLENDRATSYEVLQVQRDLTFARAQEIRALADYNKALSQLYMNEGTILRRSGLELKVK